MMKNLTAKEKEAKKLLIEQQIESWRKMKKVNMAKPEFATSRSVVWWDMDDCPVPNGYEPCRIGPRIDTELKSLGYNGELTIIAVGNLEGIPYDFLKALSSGGVVIKHSSFGIFDEVLSFFLSRGQPPISIMLISTNVLLRETITRNIYMRDVRVYNLLLAYPPNSEPEDPHPSSLVFVGGEWLWSRDSLLKDSTKEETRRLDTGCEQFSCKSCIQFFTSFEDFKVHLETNEHATRVRSGTTNRELRWSFKKKKLILPLQRRILPPRRRRQKKLVVEQQVASWKPTAMAKKQSKASNLEFQKEEADSSLAKKNPTAKEKKASNLEFQKEEADSSLAKKNPTAKEKKASNLEFQKLYKQI